MTIFYDVPLTYPLLYQFVPLVLPVRCFFEGALDTPDPADLRFHRVPANGEFVDHQDQLWRVTRVRWTVDGPMLTLSLVP